MNIILIDDHSLFRSGIETMLTSLEPKTVIRNYADCKIAIDSEDNPEKINLILLDYNIPGSDTKSNIQNVREHFESAKIVIVSGEDDPSKIILAIDSGVSGFIPKSSEPEVLIAALKLILAGGVYLPSEVLTYQGRQSATSESSKVEEANNPLKKLTERQLEVLMHVIDGKNNKTIAREVDLSLGTIKAHLSAAYTALGVSNRTEAVVMASKILNESS
ncbi:MAG: response regulator transcription factor [Acidiferrobacterales bacterium]|nr:response regulator transcription factor [Acidiferrobacterales bacterium]